MPTFEANHAAHLQYTPSSVDSATQTSHLSSFTGIGGPHHLHATCQNSGHEEEELTVAGGGARHRSVCVRLPPEQLPLLCCSARGAPCPSAYPAAEMTVSQEPLTHAAYWLTECLCRCAVPRSCAACLQRAEGQLEVSCGCGSLPAPVNVHTYQQRCRGATETTACPAIFRHSRLVLETRWQLHAPPPSQVLAA